MSKDPEKQSHHDRRKDYNSNADKLWSLYNKEAEEYDTALMDKTWKDDMDSIVIFAGLFSAVLTAFLIDSLNRLSPNPTDQTNLLLNQTVLLLTQISKQLGPNGSQIVASPPPPLEPFQVTNSDLRVNIFWFMSLVFSLGAALAATLVQQWVRDYLQLFKRLSGSLERSRMRQFLFQGLSSNHIRVLVEFIPTCIHISLLLFFIGLLDTLFATNRTVAITISIFVGFGIFFYIACSVCPVLYTRTPYHTPLSKVFWAIAQIFGLRKYSNNDTEGKVTPVSPDMAKGRLQIAMGYFGRRERDCEAIRWVLTKFTEDREFEPFLAGLTGSFASEWGQGVWEHIISKHKSHRASGKSTGDISKFGAMNAVEILKFRIDSLLTSCADSTLLDEQTRFTRAYVCIDAVASLKLIFKDQSQFNVDLEDLMQVLVYFSQEKRRREKLRQEAGIPPRSNQAPRLRITGTLFETKWKCMAIIAMKDILQQAEITTAAGDVLERLQIQHPISKAQDSIRQEFKARILDDEVSKAWRAGSELRSDIKMALNFKGQVSEEKHTLMSHWKTHIETMQKSLNALLYEARLDEDTDVKIINLVNLLMRKTGDVFEHLGGACFEWPSDIANPVGNIMVVEIQGEVGGDQTYTMSKIDSKWIMPCLLPPRLLVSHLLVCAHPTLRTGLDPRTSGVGTPTHINLSHSQVLDRSEIHQLMVKHTARGHEALGHAALGYAALGYAALGHTAPGHSRPFEKQLWRLRDLKDGGIGFMIELFFTTFRSLEETPESNQFIDATLQVITEDGKSEALKGLACQRCLMALREELIEAKRSAEEKMEITSFIVKKLLRWTEVHVIDKVGAWYALSDEELG